MHVPPSAIPPWPPTTPASTAVRDLARRLLRQMAHTGTKPLHNITRLQDFAEGRINLSHEDIQALTWPLHNVYENRFAALIGPANSLGTFTKNVLEPRLSITRAAARTNPNGDAEPTLHMSVSEADFVIGSISRICSIIEKAPHAP